MIFYLIFNYYFLRKYCSINLIDGLKSFYLQIKKLSFVTEFLYIIIELLFVWFYLFHQFLFAEYILRLQGNQHQLSH